MGGSRIFRYRPALTLPSGEGLHCARIPSKEPAIEPDRNPEFWRRHARRYDRAIGWLNRGFDDVVQRAARDVKGCASVLDFGDANFDAVVAANLLHLLDDPRRALAEMRRVLRPGGLLCVPTFAHGENLRARIVSHLLSARGFPVVTRFRGAGLRNLVEACGFETVDEACMPGILPVRYLLARRA